MKYLSHDRRFVTWMSIVIIIGGLLILVPPFFSNTQESVTWLEILESIGASFPTSGFVSLGVEYVNFRDKEELREKQMNHVKDIFINMDIIDDCHLFPKKCW